ncbi:MAG: UDP-3-O-[3-hydroxymyristoyl] glucosamine N-acyltransferase [bacterium]|jgi:UDP-3-O-[3-hydroxymyristoyl] glucosamine N-acyltransferase
MLLILMSLMSNLAHAQDSNEDGCVDSYYDSNTACVAPSATIGRDISIGAGAFIGPRSTLVGRVSASGLRPVGAGSILSRNVSIAADHDIGTENTFGRLVAAGARLQTESDVTIRYASVLGDDVSMGASATIGALVEIGNNTQVASGTVIARGVTIADSLSSTSIGGIIGPNVVIGSGNSIDGSARIRKGAVLGNNATVQANARIGRDALIGADTIIGANVRIAARGQVTATTTVPDGTVVRAGEIYDNPAEGEFGDWLLGTACNGADFSGGCTTPETGYHFKGIYGDYACWWHTKNQAWNTTTSTNLYSLAQEFGLNASTGVQQWCSSFASTPNPTVYASSYNASSQIGAWGWCGGAPFASGGWACFRL